jgi:protein-L-isoaspartate O-methyltransferase
VLFDSIDGARAAFRHLKAHHDEQQGSVKEPSSAVGNEWAAYSFISGTVGTSEKVQVYYRYLFRRGNMVSIVQVNGAQEFMEIERARALAAVIDQKALGQRVAPTPTPAATQAPIVVPPSPTRTP